MRHESIECGDVSEAELNEGVLQYGDAGRVGRFGGGGVVDGFDDFVDVGGDQGIYILLARGGQRRRWCRLPGSSSK